MPRCGFLLLLGLTACAGTDGGERVAAVNPDPSGWRLASGKPPSGAEFAAVVATCEEMAKKAPLDRCLDDLGLRRAP